MEIARLAAVNAAGPGEVAAAIDVIANNAAPAEQPPAMSHAATCTGFDRQACVPDPVGASIAATAAAQDLRLFTQGPRMRRRMERDRPADSME